MVETGADFVGSKGRTETEVRDMACGGRPVRLVWRKRRWYYPEPHHEVKTWTEHADAIAPQAGLRVRVAWSTAMAAVVAVGMALVDDPGREYVSWGWTRPPSWPPTPPTPAPM